MSDKGLDVLVGVPLHGMNGSFQFLDMLNAALAYTHNKGYSVERTLVPSSLLPTNRNNIVERAIKKNAKYVMMFDSDQTFPPDIIVKFMEYKKPFVSALYFMKSAPSEPLMMKQFGDYYARMLPSVFGWEYGDLVECDAVGGGAILIDMEVIKALPKPWFACPPKWMSYNGAKRKFEFNKRIMLDPEKVGLVTGEDVWFCHLVRECGFPIVVDTGMILGHIGEHVFSDKEYQMAYDLGLFEGAEKTTRDLIKEYGEDKK